MDMKRKYIAILFGQVLILVCSCSSLESKKETRESENRILQQKDGTVSLILDKADFYNDAANPSNNTADWDVVITKPGHYKVWLSSATKDTSDLNYSNSVRISLLDNQLLTKPSCDKIVQNSSEVNYPYFRADSYMGSVYISEPGEYNVQLTSEKVIAKSAEAQNTSLEDTKLMSVILTPGMR
jgi:hypothetical protein